MKRGNGLWLCNLCNHWHYLNYGCEVCDCGRSGCNKIKFWRICNEHKKELMYCIDCLDENEKHLKDKIKELCEEIKKIETKLEMLSNI